MGQTMSRHDQHQQRAGGAGDSGGGTEELYERPGFNFSQRRVGYDPHDPRTVHSEYYECDPLEEGRRAGEPRPDEERTGAAALYADPRASFSQESHGVYLDARTGYSPEPLGQYSQERLASFSTERLGRSQERLAGYSAEHLANKYDDRQFDPAPARDGSRSGHEKTPSFVSGYAPYNLVDAYMTPSVTSLPLGLKPDHGDSGRDLLDHLPPQERRKPRSACARVFGAAVEERGIERVPESERNKRHLPGLLLLWWSVNLVVSTFPIGGYFGLSFRMAVTASVVFSAVGAAFTAYVATLGPQTGLRTLVISRYAVGYAGGTAFAILNILTQLGFSCVAVILGGQTLTHVSAGKLPLEAAIVVVGFLALVLCFVGYGAVHYWTRVAWVPLLALFCCLWALGAKEGFDLNAQEARQPTGKAFAAAFLSYGGIVFSSAAGWAPLAADFNCRLPSNTPRWLVFGLTWLGLMLPLVFVETLSAALMTVPAYAAAFAAEDAGGVLARVLQPWAAGGKVVMGFMAFSIVANVAPNTYSAALSAQTLLPWLARVPRWAWCVVMFCAYTAAAIGGRAHFSEVLSNFLSILGYWVAFFVVVIFEEALLFRRHLGWDLDAYNNIRELPLGVAGIVACLCGAGGAVVGMAQAWYVGPLGAVFGGTGGDLGFEMSAVVTAVVYPPLRFLEIQWTGR